MNGGSPEDESAVGMAEWPPAVDGAAVSADPPVTPACPHCGYDLSGIPRSWGSGRGAACPLAGVCSECGTFFLWREVFRPDDTARHARLFDHARGVSVYELGGTVLLALRPRLFWRVAVRQSPARMDRLALAALAAPMLTYGLVIALLMPLAVAARMAYWLIWQAEFFEELLAPMVWVLGDWDDGWLVAPVSPWPAMVVAMFLAQPAACLAMATALGRCGVGARTVARIWVWSLAWMPVALGVWGAAGLAKEIATDVYWVLPVGPDAVPQLIAVALDYGRKPLTVVAGLVLLALWWRAALAAHGDPRAALHAAVLTVIAFLLGAAVGTGIWLMGIYVESAQYWMP